MMNEKHPYDELYLYPLKKLHRLLYIMLNDEKEYNVFDAIDSYMQTSDVRKEMDRGLPRALNKGWKQLKNSIDFSRCSKEDIVELDDTLLHWMADVYTQIQWLYNVPSKTISEKVPARTLAKIFNPLHEMPLDRACERIYLNRIKETNNG